MKATELKEELVRKLAENEKIKGIGQTGSIDAVLIPGKSDIDMGEEMRTIGQLVITDHMINQVATNWEN